MKRGAIAAAYLLSIYVANWAIANVGTQLDPHGPHTLPVGFGLIAPSGVYVVALTLVLRDVVQRQFGKSGKVVAFGLILVGTALTAVFVSPALAFASAFAFLASETVDLIVYTLTEKRLGELGAVLASNAVSIVVDSVLFLALAFGSMQFLEGQVVGKVWGTLAGFAILAAFHWHGRRAVAA